MKAHPQTPCLQYLRTLSEANLLSTLDAAKADRYSALRIRRAAVRPAGKGPQARDCLSLGIKSRVDSPSLSAGRATRVTERPRCCCRLISCGVRGSTPDRTRGKRSWVRGHVVSTRLDIAGHRRSNVWYLRPPASHKPCRRG